MIGLRIQEVKDCSILVVNVLVLLDFQIFEICFSSTLMTLRPMKKRLFQMKMVSLQDQLSSPRVNGSSCKRVFATNARSSNSYAFVIGFKMSANSSCKI